MDRYWSALLVQTGEILPLSEYAMNHFMEGQPEIRQL